MTRLLIIMVAALMPLLSPQSAAAEPAFVPRAKAWTLWERTGGGYSVDYTPWNRFLKRYLRTSADGASRVAYGEVRKTDQLALGAFLAQLEAEPVFDMTRAEQMAYWINLYNVATVDLVLKHYPVSTIRKIHGGLFRTGPWNRDLLNVEGETLSLNDIEHRILRPLFSDPRIHFAVNCASVGCPDLAAEAFAAETLDRQLDEAARAFINHPRAFRLEEGELIATSLFHWYGVDFGGEAGVLAFARRHAEDRLRHILAGRKDWDDHDYDWSLNDAG